MAGCIQGECYYVPDVPWTQYFTNYGHALHGAYWHNDFGSTRSHGCVNLPLWFAEWLWNWATYGTRIWIHY
jgi:lipoprotein-anchoring transpeptidase ErfK/SrfK